MKEKTSIKDFFSPDGEGHKWWRSIQPSADGAPERRGDRAELRRCKSLSDVLIAPSFHRLRNLALSENVGFGDDEILAAIAGILAHTESSVTERFGASMAANKENGQNAKVSGLRFRRLLEVKDLDELYLALIRIIRMMGRSVPVPNLAADMKNWKWEDGRDRVRKEWARDYYMTNCDET